MTKAALKLPRSPKGLIDTPAALAEVCDHLGAAKVFGFDTEFIRELSYRPVLCLVQVATDERVELIDPLALEDLGPFWDLLADPAVEKICHARGPGPGDRVAAGAQDAAERVRLPDRGRARGNRVPGAVLAAGGDRRRGSSWGRATAVGVGPAAAVGIAVHLRGR